MSRVVAAGIGAAIAIAVVVAGLAIVGHVAGPLYTGEAESTRNFKRFLAAGALAAILGALTGYKLAGRRAR